MSSDNDINKFLVAACHLCPLLGLGVIVSLIILLVSKDNLVRENAREALNFQICLYVAAFICGLLCIVFIGFLLLPILGLLAFILCVVATVKSLEGKTFRYPFILRLV